MSRLFSLAHKLFSVIGAYPDLHVLYDGYDVPHQGVHGVQSTELLMAMYSAVSAVDWCSSDLEQLDTHLLLHSLQHWYCTPVAWMLQLSSFS